VVQSAKVRKIELESPRAEVEVTAGTGMSWERKFGWEEHEWVWTRSVGLGSERAFTLSAVSAKAATLRRTVAEADLRAGRWDIAEPRTRPFIPGGNLHSAEQAETCHPATARLQHCRTSCDAMPRAPLVALLTIPGPSHPQRVDPAVQDKKGALIAVAVHSVFLIQRADVYRPAQASRS
jgi:hypothetical protein